MQNSNPHYQAAEKEFNASITNLNKMLNIAEPPKGMKDNKALQNLKLQISDYIEKIENSKQQFMADPRNFESVTDHKGRMTGIKFAYANAEKMLKMDKLKISEKTITQQSVRDNGRELLIESLEKELLDNPNIEYFIITEEAKKKGEENLILLKKNGKKVSRHECTSQELAEYNIKKNEEQIDQKNNGFFSNARSQAKKYKDNFKKNKEDKNKEKTLEKISSLKVKIEQYEDESLKKWTIEMDELATKSDELTANLFTHAPAYARHDFIQKKNESCNKTNNATIKKLKNSVKQQDENFINKLNENWQTLNNQINILANQLTKYRKTLTSNQYSAIEKDIQELRNDLKQLASMTEKGKFHNEIKSKFNSLEVDKKFDIPEKTDNKIVKEFVQKFEEKKREVNKKYAEVFKEFSHEIKLRNQQLNNKFEEIKNKVIEVDTKAHSQSYENKFKYLDNKIKQLDDLNKSIESLNIAGIETQSSNKNYLMEQRENLQKQHDQFTKQHSDLKIEIDSKTKTHPEIPDFKSATGNINSKMGNLNLQDGNKSTAIMQTNNKITKNLEEVANTVKILDNAIKNVEINNLINPHEKKMENSIQTAKIEVNKVGDNQNIETEKIRLQKLDKLIEALDEEQERLENLINEKGGIHYDRSRLAQATDDIDQLSRQVEAQWDALAKQSIVATFEKNYEKITPKKSGSVYFNKQANDNRYDFESITEHAVKGSAVKNTLSRVFSSCCCLFGRNKNQSEQNRDEQADIGNRSTRTIYNMLNDARDPREKINIRAENKEAANDKIAKVREELIEQTKNSFRCS